MTNRHADATSYTMTVADLQDMTAQTNATQLFRMASDMNDSG